MPKCNKCINKSCIWMGAIRVGLCNKFISKRETLCPECEGFGFYEIGLHREGKCETCKGIGIITDATKNVEQ